MTLLEQLNNDMITYMKAKDSFSLGVIRMVKGAVQLEKINKKRDLNDEEVVAVISKQIKMRNDSIAEFEKAGRTDLVEQNKKEVELLRKYIAHARRLRPKLTDDAMAVLEEFYVSMRNSSNDDDSPVPITARQLEAIIRLSEASAKIKLKDEVEVEDAKKAIRLTTACLEEVGYDPDTGKIDIDKVEGRPPKSERNKFMIVQEVIEELQVEYGGRAPMNILISELGDNYSISEEKAEEIINLLKHKGVIFEPTRGYLKKV